ncbi:MAG: DUF1273 family protein [Clostridia bacterium]|nr:DUF1273 family protein [Clostridia bacterium]
MMLDRNVTVCFTGHRDLNGCDTNALCELLRKTILIYIKRGYKNFICGGAVGFDSVAAQCVAEIRKEYDDIKLILALPCRDQTSKWNSIEELAFYKKMLGVADEVVYTGVMYSKGCMHLRNRYMVDNSSVCIAYKTSGRGGTAYTCRYAEKSGIEVVNLGKFATQLSFC